jgi:hypothetical protein
MHGPESRRAVLRACFAWGFAAATLVAHAASARPPILEEESFAKETATSSASCGPVIAYSENFDHEDAGWVAVNLGQMNETTFWHLDSNTWWCGTDDTGLCFASPPGYGPYWIQDLTKDCVLPSGPVELRFVHQYDTEPDFDICRAEISTDGGQTFAVLSRFSGSSGGFVTSVADLSAYAGAAVVIRFRFTSDHAWDDFDGAWPTDGAWRIAEVAITGMVTDDFEQGACGWAASVPASCEVGGFRTELDPPCNPALTCFAYGRSWVAYDEAGTFPYPDPACPWSDEYASSNSAPYFGIESPFLPIPAAGRYFLEFDVYNDAAFQTARTAMQWQVASSRECTRFEHSNVFNALPSTGWSHRRVDITTWVAPGATEIKLRLAASDWGALTGGGSGNHTSAPYFDNVTVIAENVTVPVSIAGGLASSCGGVLPGVTIRLLDAGGALVESQATASDGRYVFEDLCPGAFTLAVETPPGFAAVAPSALHLLHSVEQSLTLQCLEVEVTGTVSALCQGPLANVTVDLLDASGDFRSAVTDADGRYRFTAIPFSAVPGDAEVWTSVPLGYVAANPSGGATVLTLDQDRIVDFTFACLEATGPPRSMGYWKHQANVYLSSRGSAQESDAAMRTAYPELIFRHFYENALNSIDVSEVTYRLQGGVPVPIDLQTIATTLAVGRGATMLDHAKQQYLSLLLNVASGKLQPGTVVSQDGATCSQALQQVAMCIKDGDVANDETAKDIAEAINNAELVSAGVIDLGIEHIPYKLAEHASGSLHVGPTPARGTVTVSFDLAEAQEVAVRVYSTAGRLVYEDARRTWSPGRHDLTWDRRDPSGHRVPAGVYFVQVRSGARHDVRRLVLLP